MKKMHFFILLNAPYGKKRVQVLVFSLICSNFAAILQDTYLFN